MENLDKEIWKDIKGFEGHYQVSNMGRVKSLDYNDTGGRVRKSKVLKPKIDKDGYLEYALSNKGKKKWRRGHRLVASSFIREPKQKEQINHKDGNKMNNTPSNLEWVSSKENIRHSWETGLANANHCRGENNVDSKLTEKDVLEIRERAPNELYKNIGKDFDISEHYVQQIVAKKRWKHI